MFLRNYQNEKDRQELLEAMMDLRAEFAIKHAIKGFGMDFEKALELVRRKKTGLSRIEKDQRDILIAAIDNLIDFAVAEEFQMSDDLPEDIDPDDDDLIDYYESICHKYNGIYARIENGDIEHSMWIAAWWAVHTAGTVLTYMTQGDERVRPWHRALEGTSYPKKDFPAWLIPPIEHGCRCYLVEESKYTSQDSNVESVQASSDIPAFVNPVFMESVAKGGRIFGPAHSYFTIPEEKKKELLDIAKKLKKKWLSK